MNIFRTISNYFRRKRELQELFDDIQDMDEVLLDKRLEVFQEIVSPAFAEIGLHNWNGKYRWFSDFSEEGIKHVIEYQVFKGYGGSFYYGICFDFIPTISGKKLIFHRTEKSTRIIYEKLIEGWQNDKEGKSSKPYKVKTFNEHKFRVSLNKVLWYNTPKIQKWFKANTTLAQITNSLLEDVKNPPYMHEFEGKIITYEYILAFIYKNKKDTETSQYWINKHFEKSSNTELEIELIQKKLDVMN